MVLWPFLILSRRELKNDRVFMNHERIHLRQQLELLVVPFYLWYGFEFLVLWIHHKNAHTAYRNISFEKEAYKNEKDLDYLKKRPFWGFISLIN